MHDLVGAIFAASGSVPVLLRAGSAVSQGLRHQATRHRDGGGVECKGLLDIMLFDLQ